VARARQRHAGLGRGPHPARSSRPSPTNSVGEGNPRQAPSSSSAAALQRCSLRSVEDARAHACSPLQRALAVPAGGFSPPLGEPHPRWGNRTRVGETASALGEPHPRWGNRTRVGGTAPAIGGTAPPIGDRSRSRRSGPTELPLAHAVCGRGGGGGEGPPPHAPHPPIQLDSVTHNRARRTTGRSARRCGASLAPYARERGAPDLSPVRDGGGYPRRAGPRQGGRGSRGSPER
jgi:hypothetical protein